MVPRELRYTREHEWVRASGDEATIGITEFAAHELGDVVFVELPAVGTTVEQHATFGVVESVKAVSDLFAPVSGEVIAINSDLSETPELVNTDPYEGAWMIRVRMRDPGELEGLLDASTYDGLTAS